MIQNDTVSKMKTADQDLIIGAALLVCQVI